MKRHGKWTGNLDYIATDGLAPDTKPLSYVFSHLGGVVR